MIGQMYVQFEIPVTKKRNAPPVIMVHGSSHTAACLESTPDGREGWYPYFVRKGVSTYLVDQAGRGRSGFDESVIHEAAAMLKNGDTQGGEALMFKGLSWNCNYPCRGRWRLCSFDMVH